ncbi:MAG TPA: glycosyltransferase [Gemmatimonadaceae bacterium]|nr:glycosyltransferase [Gemmatimonadaceae bacterium]
MSAPFPQAVRRPARRPTARPRVTAVVCTRGRPHQLARALRSLLAQRPAVAEILVVDNAPVDDATRGVVAALAGRVRYLREPRPGLDVARNRALRAATGQVVAFLDDDAVAHPRWAATIERTFARGARVAACTGRVEALARDDEGARMVEANGGFDRGARRIALPRDARRPLHGRRAPLIAWAVSVGSGCSMAVRRRPALALGGFDELLDRGPDLPGGGDHDMLWRLLVAGYEVVYEPAVRARHEHRRTRADAARQIVGHQRALVAFLVKAAAQAPARSRWAIVAFLGWRLAKPGVRLVRRLAGRDPLDAATLARMWAECLGGLRAGLAVVRRDDE